LVLSVKLLTMQNIPGDPSIPGTPDPVVPNPGQPGVGDPQGPQLAPQAPQPDIQFPPPAPVEVPQPGIQQPGIQQPGIQQPQNP
jgi:hypothetical protein